MPVGSRQLLAYRFPPGSRFEGQLVGALERIESGGTMRILDALFVGRDADSGEVVAVSMSSDGTAGMIGSLLSFRLDDHARQTATDRALEGPAGTVVRAVVETLAPGEALASVLVEHTWAVTLREAIDRLGGSQLLSESGEADEVDNAWDRLASLRQDG
ncbi:MAG: hypothetical protein ACLPTJ_20920 [Solirubrobacteraceae bacterium]